MEQNIRLEEMAHNINMRNMEKIISTNSMETHTRNQLLRKLLDGISLDDLQTLVDLKNEMHSIPPPKRPAPKTIRRPVPIPGKNKEKREHAFDPEPEFRDDYKPTPVPTPRRSVKEMVKNYEDSIIPPAPRTIRRSVPTPEKKE